MLLDRFEAILEFLFVVFKTECFVQNLFINEYLEAVHQLIKASPQLSYDILQFRHIIRKQFR